MCHADADMISELVGQVYTAFTTGGSSGAFTLTPLPAISAYSAPMRYHVKFHVAGNGSDTINISGLGTKNLKQYDAGGNKVAPVITAGFSTDIIFDGTDVVILDPLPSSSSGSSSGVRQTVRSGPVDSSGNSAFGGSTGSTTVTATGTLKATAMAGGDQDYTGSITNPSWTGLSTNGTMYLFLDITSGGAVSTASSTQQYVAQPGGTPATTNGLLTVNWQEGKCYLGNGTTAPQAYRVAVGEVTVSGGVVTAIIWYALNGKYDSGLVGNIPGASGSVNINHNLGVKTSQPPQLYFEFMASVGGYSVGNRVTNLSILNGSYAVSINPTWTDKTAGFSRDVGNIRVILKGGGGNYDLSTTDAKYGFIHTRGWGGA
jgi:hypothetical protein